MAQCPCLQDSKDDIIRGSRPVARISLVMGHKLLCRGTLPRSIEASTGSTPGTLFYQCSTYFRIVGYHPFGPKTNQIGLTRAAHLHWFWHQCPFAFYGFYI